MAKKEKQKTRHEKQINIRLFGADLSSFNSCETNPKDIFRSGLYNEDRKKQSKKEIKLKSQIHLLNNRIMDNQLRIEADKLLLTKLLYELNEVKGFSEEKKKLLLAEIEKEFNDFIEDEKYAEDIRNDFNEFYTIKRDAITNKASKFGRTYEQAIELFDEYHAEMEQNSILENTRTIEYDDV